jgi:hypothetical protein
MCHLADTEHGAFSKAIKDNLEVRTAIGDIEGEARNALEQLGSTQTRLISSSGQLIIQEIEATIIANGKPYSKFGTMNYIILLYTCIYT